MTRTRNDAPEATDELPPPPDYGPVLPLSEIAAKLDEVVNNLKALESADPYLADATAFAEQAKVSLAKQLASEGLDEAPKRKAKK